MGARGNRKNNHFIFRFQSSIGTTVLALLAMAAAAKAQVGKQPVQPVNEIASQTLVAADSANAEPTGAAGAHTTNEPVSRRLKLQKFDSNRSVFYKNKLEFAFDGGRYPTNIPFPFDFLLGDGYNMTPLKYTLAPFIVSVRWQMNNISGPPVLRGNWEMSFGGTYTMIPRGPETRFFAYVMGIRRNFVPRNWRVTPYLDGHVGMGDINAKEPYGATWAQGQDLTFTLMLGAGARYNINSRFGFSAGMGYMHISNLYLSEPKYLNYGINVFGPTAGLTIRIGKEKSGRTAQQNSGVSLAKR